MIYLGEKYNWHRMKQLCKHNIQCFMKSSIRLKAVCNVCEYEAHVSDGEMRAVVVYFHPYTVYRYKNSIFITKKGDIMLSDGITINKAAKNPIDATTIKDDLRRYMILI